MGLQRKLCIAGLSVRADVRSLSATPQPLLCHSPINVCRLDAPSPFLVKIHQSATPSHGDFLAPWHTYERTDGMLDQPAS